MAFRTVGMVCLMKGKKRSCFKAECVVSLLCLVSLLSGLGADTQSWMPLSHFFIGGLSWPRSGRMMPVDWDHSAIFCKSTFEKPLHIFWIITFSTGITKADLYPLHAFLSILNPSFLAFGNLSLPKQARELSTMERPASTLSMETGLLEIG